MLRLVPLIALIFLNACSSDSARLSLTELPTHDRLSIEVQHSREVQQQAQKAFTTLLQEFQSASAGALSEEGFDKLNQSFKDAGFIADRVSFRTSATHRAAENTFNEWEADLSHYTNEGLRDASRQNLESARARYDTLITAMQSSETKMRSTLAAFNEQVLYLKHNRTTRALQAARLATPQLLSQSADLSREINKAIAEANTFLGQM